MTPRTTRLTSDLKRLAVEKVKPRVDPHTWQVLRDPLQRTVVPKPRVRPSLTSLAQKYRTDKWGDHNYTPHYQRHLRHLRDKPITLLEIGIGGYKRDGQGGASLRMWEEFFPRATIIGLDIEDKSFVDGGRITTYQGSQADPHVLQRILDEHGPLHVVIDDGSHRPEHIRKTFDYLFPRIPDDGIYVIEDTQTSYWPRWGGSQLLTDPSTSMSMVKDLLDGLHWQEFVDSSYQPSYTDVHLLALHAYHNLVFLEKGNNVERVSRPKAKEQQDPDVPPVAEQRRPFRG